MLKLDKSSIWLMISTFISGYILKLQLIIKDIVFIYLSNYTVETSDHGSVNKSTCSLSSEQINMFINQ